MTPHSAHRRWARSWRRQRSQIGCPSDVELATGFVVPQRVHGAALLWCAQRRHMPPAWVTFSGAPVRPQTAHARAANAAPRAMSSPTSRPTVGGAPSASALGWSRSAAARLRSVAARPATTASTASATTRRGSLTPVALTWSTTSRWRQSGQCCPLGRRDGCRQGVLVAATPITWPAA
ncbi:MAG TPA: hypothetical protein VH561_13080 [Micromonosporaceae bacterium]